jgi:RimJ/RimL family protein N-acetyltransferase
VIRIDFQNYCIRSFLKNDANSLCKYANNYKIAKNLKNEFPSPYTIKHAEDWIAFNITQQPENNFAIANDNEVIGAIGVKFKDDISICNPEIGYWLGEPFWGKGIAANAVRFFCNYLFNNFNFNRLTANVFENNESSKKVLEKSGFVLEGIERKAVFKENSFLDLYIYGLLKEDFIR